MTSPLLLLLDPLDNVLVCGSAVHAGDALRIDDDILTAPQAIAIGHKMARRDLAVGELVMKYGAPIGTVTAAIARGEHVHLHNMTSNYLASHTRQAVGSQKG